MPRRRLISFALTAGASATLVACWSILGGDLAPTDAGARPGAAADGGTPDSAPVLDTDAADDAADALDDVITPGNPGTLDTTFGTGGVATVAINALTVLQPGWSWQTPWLAGLAVQSDGKIVYGGHGYSDTDTARWPIVLGRLNPDGTVDKTFNPKGAAPGMITAGPAPDSNFVPNGQGAVQILPSGAIAVGGYLSVPGDPPVMMVAEYTPAGALDTQFGTKGVAELTGNFLFRPPGGFLVAADGTMFVGAEFVQTAPTLVKLLPTGKPDPSFDPPAVNDASVGFNLYTAYSNISFGPLVFLPNGEVLASLGDGYGDIPDAGRGRPLAIALSSKTAQPDPDFGVLTSPAFTGAVQGIAVESDGSILFVGSTPTTIELTHFSADGKLDPSFGDGGVSSPVIPHGIASAGSLALGAGDAIIVGATLPGSHSIGVVRYAADGSLDRTFGGGGYVGIPPATGTTLVGTTQIAFDSLGRILCGTVVSIPNSGVPVVQIARFWP